MSPGAFWGRPGAVAPNPYINPAVGAPVHLPHHQSPAVSPMGYAGYEPQGYFPPVPVPMQGMEDTGGYFPFVDGQLAQGQEHAQETGEDMEGERTSGPVHETENGSDEGVPGRRKDDGPSSSEGTHTTADTATGAGPSSCGTSWASSDRVEALEDADIVEKLSKNLCELELSADDLFETPVGEPGKQLHPRAYSNTTQTAQTSASAMPLFQRADSDPIRNGHSSS